MFKMLDKQTGDKRVLIARFHQKIRSRPCYLTFLRVRTLKSQETNDKPSIDQSADSVQIQCISEREAFSRQDRRGLRAACYSQLKQQWSQQISKTSRLS